MTPESDRKHMNKLLAALLFILTFIAAGTAYAHENFKEIPEEAFISGVVGHAQSLNLSCESRSASDWAAFWGVTIAELDFLDRLPRSDNPNQGYVGDPNGTWGYTPPNGYGVHADPVANILRSFGLDAHAGSGLSWDEIRTEIAAGRPAIVWVIGQVYSGKSFTYLSDDGAEVRVAPFEHTMILIGYDAETVHLVDAFTGRNVSHSLENFLESWAVLGNMAVVGRGSAQEIESDQLQKESEASYTVKSGDTLAKIATAWNVSWQRLAANNQIDYPYSLPVGRELIIPTSQSAADIEAETEIELSDQEVHTVVSGEHLVNIARDWDVDWKELASYNNLESPYLLIPGDELIIPGTGTEQKPVPSLKDAPPPIIILDASESLYSLAHRYDLSWIDLAALNFLNYPYMLQQGQEIRLSQ